MARCRRCGVAFDDRAGYCPSCGTPVSRPASDGRSQPSRRPQQSPVPRSNANGNYGRTGNQYNRRNDYSARFSQMNDTRDETANYDRSDIEHNKAFGILAYISWLVLIPLFAAKQSRFARFHVNQGLLLAIAEIAWAIATSVTFALLRAIGLNLLVVILRFALLYPVNVVFVIFAVIGIVNAAQGRAKELPIIGKYRILR